MRKLITATFMIIIGANLTSCSKDSHSESTSHTIGQSYGGGIIFYLDSTGNHGLIAATSDLSVVYWGSGTIITNATATVLGTGQANTNAIIAAQGVGSYSASLCDQLVLNGMSDWYLPSKDELSYMFNQKALIGGFNALPSVYWSSSETSTNSAWIQNFYNGAQASYGKFTPFSTRPIRSF